MIEESPAQPPVTPITPVIPGTSKEISNETLIKETPSKTLIVEDKVDVLRTPAGKAGRIDTLPDREPGEENNHKDLLQTRIQGTSNKKRKRIEKQTTLTYVSKKENQAKVRRLIVSDLVKEHDLPQSTPAANKETGEEPFHKDSLVEENLDINVTSSSDSFRWKKRALKTALKSSTYTGEKKENKAKVGRLSVSEFTEEREETEDEQFHKDCLPEGRIELKN